MASRKIIKSPTLSSQVMRGGMWMFSFQGFDKVLGFIRLLVLARLLAPEDFGLMGIAMLVMEIINTLTQTGLTNALVQRKGDVKSYLDATWTFLLLRGFGLSVIVFALSPLVGWFFDSPEAGPLVAVVGLTLFIGGLKNIGTIYFQKNMEFGKQVRLQIWSALSDFLVTVIMAFVLRSAWALVYGLLAGNIVGVILSYTMSAYRPRFDWKFKRIRELLSYGKWIFVSHNLMLLYSNGDDILVGRLLGTSSLGLYQLAYKISNLPTTEITRVISSVMFPAYSRVQDDIKALRRGFVQVLQVTLLLSVFIGGGIAVFSFDFIKLFLGEEWLPMAPAMVVLVFWGMIRSFGANAGPIFQAIGKPKLTSNYQFIQVIILAILIIPGIQMYGLVGASVAVVVSSFVPNVLVFNKMCELLEIRRYYLFKELSSPAIAAFFAGLLTKDIPVYGYGALVGAGIAYALVYAVAMITLVKVWRVSVLKTMYERACPLVPALRNYPLVEKLVA